MPWFSSVLVRVPMVWKFAWHTAEIRGGVPYLTWSGIHEAGHTEGEVDDTQQQEEGCLRMGTHMMFILNSSLSSLFMASVKGGSGWAFLFSGMGMFPAQRTMFQFPKSWREKPCLSRAAGQQGSSGWGTRRAGAEVAEVGVEKGAGLGQGLSAGWRDGNPGGAGGSWAQATPVHRQQGQQGQQGSQEDLGRVLLDDSSPGRGSDQETCSATQKELRKATQELD